MKRFFRLLYRWAIILAVLFGLCIVAMYGYRLVHTFQRGDMLDPENLAVHTKPQTGIVNVALFGLDAADGTTRRSDCMMILSIDADDGEIKIVSLMRDSLVAIDGHGETKLNHAYSYGGRELAIRTINQNFDMNITHYAEVDFSNMANLVGAVGGVWINVQENELAELNRFIGQYCRAAGVETCTLEQSGRQFLNGIQAMSYGRIRKGGTGDDWGRVERQAIVLEALFERVKDMSSTELVSVAMTGMKYVTTDLSITKLASLILGAFSDGTPAIEHTRLPVNGQWSYGGTGNAYIVFDTDDAAKQLHDYIYNDIHPDEQE